ncbi:MAG: NAD(P)H-dependent oxidoreductase subunit E, partial [Alphaproteobacteria bacterium]
MNQESKKIHAFHHPGSSRRRTASHTKGRQVDPGATAEIAALLGDRTRRRDLLIEHLHLIQEHYGCLRPRHLAALAQLMRLAFAEVYEVATFYAHFHVARDDDTPAPRLTIRVCDSLSCQLAGAQELLATLPANLGSDIHITRAPCMGRCNTAPTAEVGHRHIDHATVQTISAAVDAGDFTPILPRFESLSDYQAGGGYKLLAECRAGTHTADEIIAILDEAGLRGLGGAGFPAARKWGFVRAGAQPRILAINADEGEPGTFKDRYILEKHPHRFLEGVLIAAWGVDA